jgi:hypothetical protein
LKSFVSNNCSNFSPEGFETALFQDGCLALRSPAKMHLCLRFKSLAMSTSLDHLPKCIYV